MNVRKIAQKAGVGVATVSRYMNRTGYVSEKAAIKIQKVIDEHSYVPNALAQAVSTNNFKTIGLIIPNLTNPFFAGISMKIENMAKKEGYSVMFCNTEDDVKREKEYIENLKRYRVAGVITMRPLERKGYSDMVSPIVSFENDLGHGIPMVTSDNYYGAHLALEHLISVGCKKILHVRGPNRFQAVYERYLGFSDAAKEKGIAIQTIHIDTDFYPEVIEEGLNKNIDFKPYDGIFVFNDMSATIVLREILKQGIRVPEDIKLVSFDNGYISKLTYPTLTTINQDQDKIAKHLFQVLFDQIYGKDLREAVTVVKTELVIRNSTKEKK